MAIGQIEIQGQITRAQDFTTIKHHEDTKGMVEQANVSEQFSKVVENQMTKVYRGEKSEYQNKNLTQKKKAVTNIPATADGKAEKKKSRKRTVKYC